jgi:SnoaL-like polyketide cyclase
VCVPPLLQYSLHAPRRGREDIRNFIMGFREAFPDLNFWGTADLIAEGDYVVGRWEVSSAESSSMILGFQGLAQNPSNQRPTMALLSVSRDCLRPS